MSIKALFGGVIALILLGLYVYLVIYAVLIVTGVTDGVFTKGMISALGTISGLISALVIAELAVTQPGEAPAARILSESSSNVAERGLRIVTFLYLAAWLATGLVAFIVGPLLNEDALPSLTDLGQAWLGIVVAAGYAYLGVNPGGSSSNRGQERKLGSEQPAI